MSTPKKKKEKSMLIKFFIVLKPFEKDLRRISVVTKYATSSSFKTSEDLVDNSAKDNQDYRDELSQVDDDDIDENSLSLFCFPDGCEIQDFPEKPSFHTFLITKQNGSRIYGSTLVIWDKLKSVENGDKYINKALCFLTSIPLVVATRKLLYYIYENNCSLAMIQSICDLKMPTRAKCLKLCLPNRSAFKRFDYFAYNFNHHKSEDVYIYRGLPSFPLFDYPLRQLFTNILKPEQFLTAFVATLLEFQILLVSESYYTLMMVSEALTSLLLPFTWQHVYVPILPSKLGLNFLDAPTPYIMGVVACDKDLTDLSTLFAGSMANGVQCRIDCDSNKVEYFTDENSADEDIILFMPSFIDELTAEINSIMNNESKPSTKMQSEALRRISELARRQGNTDSSYLEDLKFNQSIRLAFLKYIRKYILHDYEKFIVCPPNRREAASFDAVSYLCDQPDSMRCFLSKFLKTQMFVSYIDEHVKKLHKNKSTLNSNHQSLAITSSNLEENTGHLLGDEHLEEKFKDAIIIEFNEVVNSSNKSGDINGQLLASPIRQRRTKAIQESKSSKKIKSIEYAENDLSRSGSESNLTSPVKSPVALAAYTNWKVVETFLKKIKNQTKLILLTKMGNEEIAPLGFGRPENTEENTLITALTNLIEAIWNHGRANHKDSDCAFWAHIVAFALNHCDEDDNPPIDPSHLSPALSRVSIESSSSSQSSPSPPSKRRQNNDYFKPVPSTFNYTLRSIQSLSDVNTDESKRRAFIRLALERKLLSKHLRVLLSNRELVEKLYKKYAFLREEDAKEQFLTHLLTLNAVDIHCFTTSFVDTILTYTLVIESSSALTGTISIGGTLRQSDDIPVINVNSHTTIRHVNLGLLSTLTIFVDPKITSKLYIGNCFVRNEITGHIVRFQCHRAFGKNIEDGATERVLVGEAIHNASIGDIMKKGQRSSSIGRWTTRSKTEEHLDVDDLQRKFTDSLNEIVRCYYNNVKLNQSSNKLSSPFKRVNNNRGGAKHLTFSPGCSPYSPSYYNMTSSSHQKSLVYLIFGKEQFLWILQQMLYFGFKKTTRTTFRKQEKRFLWDYLEQVACELKYDKTGVGDQYAARQLLDLVDSISSTATNWGKDAKFNLFLVVALRDHLLTKYLAYMIKSSRTKEFYDSYSFPLNPNLMNFLLQMLSTFSDMRMVFDFSLTKGL